MAIFNSQLKFVMKKYNMNKQYNYSYVHPIHASLPVHVFFFYQNSLDQTVYIMNETTWLSCSKHHNSHKSNEN